MVPGRSSTGTRQASEGVGKSRRNPNTGEHSGWPSHLWLGKSQELPGLHRPCPRSTAGQCSGDSCHHVPNRGEQDCVGCERCKEGRAPQEAELPATSAPQPSPPRGTGHHHPQPGHAHTLRLAWLLSPVTQWASTRMKLTPPSWHPSAPSFLLRELPKHPTLGDPAQFPSPLAHLSSQQCNKGTPPATGHGRAASHDPTEPAIPHRRKSRGRIAPGAWCFPVQGCPGCQGEARGRTHGD